MPADDALLTAFNGLAAARPSLPAAWYRDPAHHAREMRAVFARSWVCAGRADALPGPLAFRTLTLAGDRVLLLRDEAGALRAFLNVCRHRGAELCAAEAGTLDRPAVTCPYHQWVYRLSGALAATGPARPVEGFDRAAHGLIPVALAEWGGYVFLNLEGEEAPPFESSPGVMMDDLRNWPVGELVVGHVWEKELACDWKVFWENFNECLHCPGVHPSLCELVPIYGRGAMVAKDHPDWAERADSPEPVFTGRLRDGAETWSRSGRACGPALPGLTEAERRAGQTYAVAWPSFFAVGHVDYVRTMRVEPLGPGRTRLAVEWLFPAATLAAPGFDLADVVDFAKTVIAEDGAACETNQRGLDSPSFAGGVLMQEEYDVYAFQQWVRAKLDAAA